MSSSESALRLRRHQLEPVALLESVAAATSGTGWWLAAGLVLVGGGAAAGLPIGGWSATFWHVANGLVIMRHGLAPTATYLARGEGPLDTRSWLLSVLTARLYLSGGATALAVAGGLAGAALGALILLAARGYGRLHPLALLLVAAIGWLALAPVIDNLPAEALGIMGTLLLLELAALRQGRRWAPAGLVLLFLVWGNLQSAAELAALLASVSILLARVDRSRGRTAFAPPLWLIPLVLLALLVNPRGPALLSELGPSLGLGGGQGQLALWSVIDFHPWQARFAEICGVFLVFSYWGAGRRLLLQDTWLGLISAGLALLWTVYLPLFLVVAAVQAPHYLSLWVERAAPSQPRAATRPGWRPPRALALLSLIPMVAVAGTIGFGIARESSGGGPAHMVRTQLPVAAASWLEHRRLGGTWYTTPAFGDYLAARFPAAGRLLCTDDPLPGSGRLLADCAQLAVLNSGAMKTLHAMGVSLAVLPRDAPQVAFLLAQHWQIRYRDRGTAVLSPAPR